MHTIALGGASIRTLSPGDLLLFLSLHGTKHVWDRVKWIADVARFVRRYDGLDWDRTLHDARAAGTERMILVGLWLARDLLATPVPAVAARRIEEDAAVGVLGREVCERLFTRRSIPDTFWPPWRFNIRARERVSDKTRCGSALGPSDVSAAARRVLASSRTSPTH